VGRVTWAIHEVDRRWSIGNAIGIRRITFPWHVHNEFLSRCSFEIGIAERGLRQYSLLWMIAKSPSIDEGSFAIGIVLETQGPSESGKSMAQGFGAAVFSPRRVTTNSIFVTSDKVRT
jgi:hypothetical protein